MRLNSLVLFVTRVAFRASAWRAIQRSLAPMGVPAAHSWVNCLAQCTDTQRSVERAAHGNYTGKCLQLANHVRLPGAAFGAFE